MLYPYSDMKPVNIRWLNRLPKHWDIFSLKHIANINTESLSEATAPDYKIQYIDIGNVTLNGLTNEPEILKFEDSPSRARRVVHDGDTIISTVRTYLQAIAYFELASSVLTRLI